MNLESEPTRNFSIAQLQLKLLLNRNSDVVGIVDKQNHNDIVGANTIGVSLVSHSQDLISDPDSASSDGTVKKILNSPVDALNLNRFTLCLK